MIADRMVLAGLALSLSAQLPANAESEFGRLVAAPGVEETFYTCTACHSEMIIAQQGLSRPDWDELLIWMVDEHGMDDPPPDERTIILDYLAAHYNTDRPNFPVE
ncbi:MAG: aldehyde dehydrogenase [Roseibium sp.]|nr:aldehyde dehydrogenase [Roseibium sp.]